MHVSVQLLLMKKMLKTMLKMFIILVDNLLKDVKNLIKCISNSYFYGCTTKKAQKNVENNDF